MVRRSCSKSNSSPQTFFFSFLTIETQTKAQVMSWGNAFGKFLSSVSWYAASPFTGTVCICQRWHMQKIQQSPTVQSRVQRRDEAFHFYCNWFRSVLT